MVPFLIYSNVNGQIWSASASVYVCSHLLQERNAIKENKMPEMNITLYNIHKMKWMRKFAHYVLCAVTFSIEQKEGVCVCVG